MRLADRLLGLTLLGADWVFWILIALSILSVTIMVERAIRLSGKQANFDTLAREFVDCLASGDLLGARKLISGNAAPELEVVRAGIDQYQRGTAAVTASMASAKARLRIELERNLGVLGTLGNNAPFIGLFGTVLGIIQAFADLSHAQNGGIAVVIGGIAEALVATALGLLVAIPAVIAFNFFQGKIRRIMGRVDAAAQLVLVGMTGPAPTNGASDTKSSEAKI